MTITQRTPDFLVVDHRPWLWSLLTIVLILGCIGAGFAAAAGGEPLIGLAFGAAGIIAGGGAYWAVTERSQFVFSRPKNRVEIRRRRSGTASRITFPLDAVEGARVISALQAEPRRSARSRKLVIDVGPGAGAQKGPHPVDRMASNVGNHWGVADAINSWLEGA